VADKSMLFKIGARDDASTTFTRVATAAERLNNQLDELGRKHVKPKVTLDSDAARTRVTELSQALKDLKNQRVRVDVDLGTGRADVGDLRRELSYLRNANVRVRVDTGTALTDMATLGAALASFRNATATVDLRTDDALARAAVLRARLDELRDVRIKVEVDSGAARAELTAIARAARRLNGLDGTTVKLKIEVDAGNSVAQLTAIATLLREIRGTTRVRVDTDSGVTAVARLASGLGSLFKVAGGGLAIPGLIATIGQVGSLGASVMALTGVLGLVPAAGLAAGAGVATLVIGLNGLSDALGPTGTKAEIEKVAEAMARLSPEARTLVTEIRALGPAWSNTRLEVQERLLAGIGAEVQQLGSAYLPSLKAGLGGIATELNTGVRMWSDWAGSSPAVADLNTILANTRTTLLELAPAGTNVAAALTDISVVGSDIMPELATGATQATGRFREFIAQARETGQLEAWIRGGISTMEQLGRITGNTGGVLGSVFSASERAGYGFLDVVEQLTGELDDLLSSAAGQNALVAVFAESRDAVNAALPGMRELGSATLETTGAFARSDGLERFAGLVSQTASAISPLVAQIGALAGDALGNLAGGASLAVSALTPLVGGTAAVVDGLGPIPGLVLASVVAFKGLGLATASVVALGTALQVASVSAAAYTGAITGSGTAALIAGRGTLALGTAVSALGRNLPLIGVGLIAAAAGYDLIRSKSDDLAKAVVSGSITMREAIAAETQQINNRNVALGAIGLGVLANQSAMVDATVAVTQAYRDQVAALSPLEQAQLRAREAQATYNAAVRDHGPASVAARDAAAGLAAATDDVEAAQRAADDAAKSYSDRLRDQAAAAQSALGANVQLEDALARVAVAHDAANAAASEHGAGSEEAAAATREYVLAADQAAQAAQKVAEGLGGADAGTAAYGATLLNLAANAQGPAREAMLSHLSLLSQAELDSLSAGAAALGFATQIITLPNGKTVTIAVDPETGKIVDTQTLLDGMRDGDVAVNLETQAALDALAGLMIAVNVSTGTVNINGNNEPAGNALQTVLAAIAAGQGTVTINGQDVPARSALQQILGQIDASGATVEINGQNVPAAQVLRSTLSAIDSGAGTVTIGGQSIPAQSALRAILGSVNGSNGTMTILGRDGGVEALKNRLSIPTSSTHTVYVRQVGNVPGKGTQTINHDGNIIPARATRYHDGGVATAYATGGMRPFRAGTAQIFPPRMLRVTGDRVDVDEFYIPDNNARRSLSLGAEWARRRGMKLTPRAIPIAARPSMGAGTFDLRRIDDVRRPAAGDSTQLIGIARVLAQRDVAIRGELAELGEYLRSRPPVAVTQNFPTQDPVEAATSGAMALRQALR
jgi:hypothetical protein